MSSASQQLHSDRTSNENIQRPIKGEFTELQNIKEKLQVINNEIARLNLSKDQIDKLNHRKEEAKKRNLCEHDIVKQILTAEQISRVHFIRQEIYKMDKMKNKLVKQRERKKQSTKFRKIDDDLLDKPGKLFKIRIDKQEETKKPFDKQKLSSEQITTINAINKQIDKVKMTRFQMIKLISKRNGEGKLKPNKNMIGRLLLIKQLSKELRLAKEQIVKNQITDSQIRRVNLLIQQVAASAPLLKTNRKQDMLKHSFRVKFAPLNERTNHAAEQEDEWQSDKEAKRGKRGFKTSIRHARSDDIPGIEMLCNEHTEAMFNVYDIGCLIGSCWLSIVMVDERERIVAFMAINDYPNVPFIPKNGWEQWMLNMYQTKEYTPPTARFLHFLAWDEKRVNEDFLEKLIPKVFGQDPYVKYLLFILPPGQKMCLPYSRALEHYLDRRNLDKEMRSSRRARLGQQPYLLGLYVAYRHRFGPTIRIKNSVDIYNEQIAKNLQIVAPYILNLYGKDFYKRLISAPKKKRLTITAECSYKKEKSFGVMTLTTRINKRLLEEYFDTFPYHGFRVPSSKDTWYKIYLRKQLIQETNKLLPESKPIFKSIKAQGKIIKESSGNQEDKIKRIERHVQKVLLSDEVVTERNLLARIQQEDEALRDQSDPNNEPWGKCNMMNEEGMYIDMDLRLARSTGMPFTPEEIKEIQRKPTHEINPRSSPHKDYLEIKELREFIQTLQEPCMLGETPQTNRQVLEGINGSDETEKCVGREETKENKIFQREKGRKEIGRRNGGRKLKENPYLHMKNTFLWRVNGAKKLMHPSTDTRVSYHGKNLAMAIELFIPSYLEHPSCCLRYLKTAFRCLPGKEYCLLTVPPHLQHLPILHYFQKVNARKTSFDYRDLYVCHRLGIMGKHSVREGDMSDFEEILAMSYGMTQAGEIHEDVLRTLLRDAAPSWCSEPCRGACSDRRSGARCLVLLAASVLVGFALVEANPDMEYYQCQYKLDHLLDPSNHRADSYGLVRHFVLAPLFRHLARFFLRGIMSLCDWTVLTAFVLPRRLHGMFRRYSLIEGLEQWVQACPRVLPQYWSRGLGARVPGWGKDWGVLHRPERALHFLTYQASGFRKVLFTSNIVVVGVGDTALSFLEHLLLGESSEHVGFRYVTVISESGLPLEYPEKFQEAVAAMIPDTSARYDQGYLDKLCLETWIKSVYGRITFIDRQNKLVHVDGKKKIRYDYLFLFCGSQFLQPIGDLEAGDKRFITDNSLEAAKQDRDLPANVFVINNHLDAYQALTKLTTSFKFLGREEGNQVVVYGNSIQAIACITGLLRFGVEAKRITLVLNPDQPGRNSMYVRCVEVKAALLETFKSLKITVYQDFTFRRWEQIDFYGTGFIKAVHIESATNTVVLKAIALFSYSPRGISHRASLVCQSAGLPFDERLFIDTDYLAGCDHIYAGGPLTRYTSLVQTESLNHEFYNSVEIGAEIAKKFLQRKLSEMKGADKKGKRQELVVFSQPLVMSAELPGGWNYLRVTRPGKEDVLASRRAIQSKLLQTGDANDKEGPGFFQIMIDEYGLVNDIVCYSTSKIDVKNLSNVYGKHECLLNNLWFKFKGGQIPDLFAYFREPWAYATYHDRFPLLMRNIDHLFLRKLPHEDASFYDLVAHSLNMEKWKKISVRDRHLLEELFCVYPNLKEKIEKQVERFLESNENVLTTYLTKGRMKDYRDRMDKSRVSESWREGRPLLEASPQYIIPERKHRREMEGRPVEATGHSLELGGEGLEARQRTETATGGRHMRKLVPEEEPSLCGSDGADSGSEEMSSLADPYPIGVDGDEEVEITVRPHSSRDIAFLSIPVEDIDFQAAIENKFKQCFLHQSGGEDTLNQ